MTTPLDPSALPLAADDIMLGHRYRGAAGRFVAVGWAHHPAPAGRPAPTLVRLRPIGPDGAAGPGELALPPDALRADVDPLTDAELAAAGFLADARSTSPLVRYRAEVALGRRPAPGGAMAAATIIEDVRDDASRAVELGRWLLRASTWQLTDEQLADKSKAIKAGIWRLQDAPEFAWVCGHLDAGVFTPVSDNWEPMPVADGVCPPPGADPSEPLFGRREDGRVVEVKRIGSGRTIEELRAEIRKIHAAGAAR